MALESALSQQLFCRGFKDRQPFKRVGNFALKLASVDKHHIIPRVTEAQKFIQRYNDNLYIFKTKVFEFNTLNYNDSQAFWKNIFEFLVQTSKEENVDTSLALQRGSYPEVETLFLNLRFPFLRDDDFNAVNPMILDVSARPQFGLDTAYILEFHDIQCCIDYLKRLWPIVDDVEIDMQNLTYEQRLKIQGQNRFELTCISVSNIMCYFCIVLMF